MEPTLFIVATPIGTLSDFSPHGIQILSEVAFVACEDTRHSGKLLAHFGIKKPLESLHEHNEENKSLWLIEKIKHSPEGCAALVTDAGTPGVSDPGSVFVALCHEHGVRVANIPGPSSLACALASSGFRQPRSLFAGFLPRKAKDKSEEMRLWTRIAPTLVVFFESPNRILESLDTLADTLGPTTSLCVSREISKKHEEHLRGGAAEVLALLKARPEILGEFAVTVNLDGKALSQPQPDVAPLTLEELAKEVLSHAAPPKEAARLLSQGTPFAARDLYNAAMALKNTRREEAP